MLRKIANLLDDGGLGFGLVPLDDAAPERLQTQEIFLDPNGAETSTESLIFSLSFDPHRVSQK